MLEPIVTHVASVIDGERDRGFGQLLKHAAVTALVTGHVVRGHWGLA